MSCDQTPYRRARNISGQSAAVQLAERVLRLFQVTQPEFPASLDLLDGMFARDILIEFAPEKLPRFADVVSTFAFRK